MSEVVRRFLVEDSVIAMSPGRVTNAAQGKVSDGAAVLQLPCVIAPQSGLLLPLTFPQLSDVASVTAEVFARIPVKGASIYPETLGPRQNLVTIIWCPPPRLGHAYRDLSKCSRP
jgi:hypothetical protein